MTSLSMILRGDYSDLIAAEPWLLESVRDLEERAAELVDRDPEDGATTAVCRGCGRPITWAALTRKDGTAGRIPLDVRAPVYSVANVEGGAIASRLPGAYVSHFATCSKANDFSNCKRKD